MKTNTKRKRTKKEFEDYNDYRDRPFGLKWGTAFAIDELNKVIVDNKEESLKVNPELEQMSREAIDDVLQTAFLKSKKVTIQLNMKDDLNNYHDNVSGTFSGYADKDCLYLDGKCIPWSLIRNIALMTADSK